MQLHYETGAVAIAVVEAQGAVHLSHAQSAHRKSQTVAFGEVAYGCERFEQVVSLLFSNAAACIGYDKLDVVRAALFEIKCNLASRRGILRGIAQKVSKHFA